MSNETDEGSREALVEQLAEAINRADNEFVDRSHQMLGPWDVFVARAVLPVVAAQVEAAVSVVRAEAKERGALVASERAHSSALRHRAESAESERDALREKVAQARHWIVNCVDPAAVGVAKKQEMLDALAPSSADGTSPICVDG